MGKEKRLIFSVLVKEKTMMSGCECLRDFFMYILKRQCLSELKEVHECEVYTHACMCTCTHTYSELEREGGVVQSSLCSLP